MEYGESLYQVASPLRRVRFNGNINEDSGIAMTGTYSQASGQMKGIYLQKAHNVTRTGNVKMADNTLGTANSNVISVSIFVARQENFSYSSIFKMGDANHGLHIYDSNGTVYATVWESGAAKGYATVSNQFPQFTMKHIFCTFNFTTKSIKLYVQGTVGTATMTTSLTYLTGTTGDICVGNNDGGRDINGTATAMTAAMHVQELVVWKDTAEFTHTQILIIMQAAYDFRFGYSNTKMVTEKDCFDLYTYGGYAVNTTTPLVTGMECKNKAEIGTLIKIATNTELTSWAANRSVPYRLLAPLSPVSDTVPTTPTGLTILGTSPTQIDFGWTASTDDKGVVGYRIFYKKSTDGTYSSIYLESNVTQYLFGGLSSSTTYNFYVVAYDTINQASANSSVVNGTTLAAPGGTTTCVVYSSNNQQREDVTVWVDGAVGVTINFKLSVTSHRGVWNIVNMKTGSSALSNSTAPGQVFDFNFSYVKTTALPEKALVGFSYKSDGSWGKLVATLVPVSSTGCTLTMTTLAYNIN